MASVKVNSLLPLPKKATPFSAGFDLQLPEDISLLKNESKKINLKIKLEMPDNVYCEIKLRSSVGSKKVILLSDLIDNDYREDLFLNVMNLSNETVQLKKGERVAQLLFRREPYVHLMRGEVTPNDRGAFGSTGK